MTPERQFDYCKLNRKGDGKYRRLISNAAKAAGRFGFKPYLERFRDRGMKSTQAYVALGCEPLQIALALTTNHEVLEPNRLNVN